MQKKTKQFYYNKTMVNFCKGCDVHVFFVEENTCSTSTSSSQLCIIKAVSYSFEQVVIALVQSCN